MAPTRTSDHPFSDPRIRLDEPIPTDRLEFTLLALHHSRRIPMPAVVTFDGRGAITSTVCCEDPVLDLRGTLAPETTQAVGVIATGTAHAIDPDPREGIDATADTSAGRGQDVRISAVVDRSGRFSTHVELLDRTPVLTGSPDTSGLMVDALRLCLGLSTDPVDFGVEPLLTVLWLEAVEAALDRGLNAPTWSELARLHPAVLTRDEGPFDDLVERCEMVAASTDWESIRIMVRVGKPPFDLDERHTDALDHAEWFDAGSFARALLAERVHPVHQLGDLGRRLEPDLFRRVVLAVSPFVRELVC